MDDDLEVSYDEFADVLYLSVGRPRSAISSQDKYGWIWRSVSEGREPFAVTIVDFHDIWAVDRTQTIQRISSGLNLPSEQIVKRLPT